MTKSQKPTKLFLISSAICLGLLASNVPAMANANAPPKGRQSRGGSSQARSPDPQKPEGSKQLDFLNRLSQNIGDPAISEKLDSIAEELVSTGDLNEDNRAYLTDLADRINTPAAAGVLRQIATNPQRPVDSYGDGSPQTQLSKEGDFIRSLSRNLNDSPISERLDPIADEIVTTGDLSQEDRAYLSHLADRLNNPTAAGVLRQIATSPPRTVDSAGEGSTSTQESKDSEFLRTLSRNLNNPPVSGRLDSIADEIRASGVLSQDSRDYLMDLTGRLNNEKVSGILNQIADRY